MRNKDFYANIINELKSDFPKSNFLLDEPMSKHTTFKIGGACDIFIEPAIDELPELISRLKAETVPITVIGNGSNLLVSDAGIEGVVISFGKAASQIVVSGEKIVAQAGVLLSRLANTALENSLTGLEFAAGIPGSVGGAVYMNAGAYGGEVKMVLQSATILTSDLQIVERPVEQLELSYRHSKLMDTAELVLSATFLLKKGVKEQIQQTMDELKEKRISKQPLNYPSAGSTFKRPEGYFAGKLIEDAGLKGYQVGGARVSDKHCGFVINYDNATAKDVIELMRDVDRKVFENAGVHLEPEVRIIGRSM